MNSPEVYVIHSHRSIEELTQIIRECGPVTYLKIIYKTSYEATKRKNKSETNKTIVFGPKSTIETVKSRYPEFQDTISEYNWETFPLPKEKEGETWNLHISGVPNDYTNRQICTEIEQLFSHILPVTNSVGNRNYNLHFPIRSRESGQILGYGSVNFSPQVDVTLIKLCKLILHNTPMTFRSPLSNTIGIESKDRRMVNCVWHRIPAINPTINLTDPTIHEQLIPKSISQSKRNSRFSEQRMKLASPVKIDMSGLTNSKISPVSKSSTNSH